MKLPSEMLIRSTWMEHDPLFNYHDTITKLDWTAIINEVATFEQEKYSNDQCVLVGVLEYLCGIEDGFVTLDEVGRLPVDERQAVLDALKAKWIGTELQEDLVQ